MRYLKPFKFPIIFQGVVSYNRDVGWNNLIRLKKGILKVFGELLHERDVFYKIEIYQKREEIIQRINDSKDATPILLFLFKEP